MPLRPVANTLFVPTWTAFMVTYAASAVALRRDPDLFRRLERVWAKGIADFSGIRVSVHGAEHMDPAQSYVVVANHQSLLDIPVLFMALPVVPGFVAKQELTKVPFLNTALKLGGHVTIDRGNRHNASRSLERAATEVRQGKTVLVFPEGTRAEANVVGKFKLGAFHLAKAAGVPIVPVGLRGTGGVMPKQGKLVRSGSVEVHIGAPVGPGEIAGMDVRPLSERLREDVARLADAPRVDAFNT